MQIRPTAFTIGLIIYSFMALFLVYTEFGIDSCVTTKEPINALTKMLYATIAANYHTTECSVERAVRHAIKSGWYRHNAELADTIFLNVLQCSSDIPTNSVFISTLSEWIRVNYADLI